MKIKINKTSYILSLLVVNLLIFGCVENGRKMYRAKETKDSTSKENLKGDSSQGFSERANNDNAVDERTITPYRQVDSLIRSINKNFNLPDVKLLEEICSTSDGDLAESFGNISKRLFESNLSDFTQYFGANPNSCLKKSLIYSLGADLFVYEKTARPGKLLDEQERLIIKARKDGLSDKKIQIINDLFKDVNPDLLD